MWGVDEKEIESIKSFFSGPYLRSEREWSKQKIDDQKIAEHAAFVLQNVTKGLSTIILLSEPDHIASEVRKVLFSLYHNNEYNRGFDAGSATVKWLWPFIEKMNGRLSSFYSLPQRKHFILAIQQIVIDTISMGLICNRLSDVAKLRAWWRDERGKYHSMLDSRDTADYMIQFKFEDRLMDFRIARSVNSVDLYSTNRFIQIVGFGIPTRHQSYRETNEFVWRIFQMRSNSSSYAVSADHIKNRHFLVGSSAAFLLSEDSDVPNFGLIEDVEMSKEPVLVHAKIMRNLAVACHSCGIKNPNRELASKIISEALQLLRNENINTHAIWSEWYSACAQYMRMIGSEHGEIESLKKIELLQGRIGNEDARSQAKEERLVAIRRPGRPKVDGGPQFVNLIDFLEQEPPSFIQRVDEKRSDSKS